ncbi:L-lactate permease [Carnobacterium antarcticum]|uniref:L-lactate permease n=1 Tax=Carnobacterium antarcticum TaxID=2126436 RepID=A0ABW4NJP9_9LACT|nr:L-lactate permease [Carnobacterium sp. CP1]ALV21441.1 L-lactate permease [Carnobacterium sp. CP1]
MVPINLLSWSLCIVPILLMLIFMIIFQWGVSKAAPITLVITALISIFFFKASGKLLIDEFLRAGWNSIGIILVILTAILSYEISYEARAFDTLNQLFKKIAPNELIRIILIGVVFASFLQGITGFGVPVLITAPLLLEIGVAPLWAVIIPLLGHSWAGTFGTLGLGWNSLLIQTGIQDHALIFHSALYASFFLLLLTIYSSYTIAYFYGGWKAVKKGFIAIAIISSIQGIGQIIFSTINPQLAAFIPSAISLGALILLSKTSLYRDEWRMENSKIMLQIKTEKIKKERGLTTHQALMPYYIVTIISLTILLIPFIATYLGSFSYGPRFTETSTGYGFINKSIEHYAPITPFTHPSMFLLVTSVLTYCYYRKKKIIQMKKFKPILLRAITKSLSPSIAIFALLSISRLMAGTGQTEVLAQGIANVLKDYYVLVAPFVGLLGSFITGSNMSSNILFGDFQLHVSEFIGLKTSAILGGQTAGGGVGTSIAPGNIILGTTTAGILGSEGRVLIKIIPLTLIIVSLFGLLLYLDYFFFF